MSTTKPCLLTGGHPMALGGSERVAGACDSAHNEALTAEMKEHFGGRRRARHGGRPAPGMLSPSAGFLPLPAGVRSGYAGERPIQELVRREGGTDDFAWIQLGSFQPRHIRSAVAAGGTFGGSTSSTWIGSESRTRSGSKRRCAGRSANHHCR